MTKKIKRAMKIALTSISPRLTCEMLFYTAVHRRPNLKDPKTLDEKLCLLKLTEYGRDPLIPRCADKYRVREYVKEKGLGFLLNECYGVYESPEEIPWEELPQSFVLKGNHGCAYNILCPDKDKLDKAAAQKQLKAWLKEDFWKVHAELNYRGIPKKILCEAYLTTPEGGPIPDYKIYCFHGKPACMMVCLDRADGATRFYFFDQEWNLLRINPDGKAAPEGFTLPKPEVVDEMFRYAEILSEDFLFVRVDFYAIGSRVVFGELTFTPASGVDPKRLPETDLMWGSMLHLPEDLAL